MTTALLAFDLDGTLVTDQNTIPPFTVQTLQRFYQLGWTIAFITGRTFAFSQTVLAQFLFPYYLAVNNGAQVIKMPQKEVLSQCYISKDVIKLLYELKAPPFIVCLGSDNEGICYYNPAEYSCDQLKYFDYRARLANEKWLPVNDLYQIKEESFPIIKWFAPEHVLRNWGYSTRIEQWLQFSVIKDGFSTFSIAQASQVQINKGTALKKIAANIKSCDLNIAAGDEANDLPMLLVANKKIVVNTAPVDLLAIADITADSAEQNGVATALIELIGIGSK